MSKHNNKQATLFQTWGKNKASTESNVSKPSTSRLSNEELIDLFGDYDDYDKSLAATLEESLRDQPPQSEQQQQSEQKQQKKTTLYEKLRPPTKEDLRPKKKIKKDGGQSEETSHTAEYWMQLQSAEPGNALSDSEIDDLEGFNKSAGRLYIYPTNYPVRDYQFNIIREALYRNTLVVLPTGLGKTFVAAVVMYNYYRWYPQGKIIFMAPTKPLVAQQIEACSNITGIPYTDTAEMTGKKILEKISPIFCYLSFFLKY